MKITKAVIPCAGRGTRFLPISRALPKELLPIVDRPCLEVIIDEVAASGIREVLIILSPEKEIVRRYFDGDPKLYAELKASGKSMQAELCLARKDVKISYAIQEKPLGTAHAVALAEEFLGGEDFALLWGDDAIMGDPPAIKQLVDAYDKYDLNIVGCQRIEKGIEKYGAMVIDRQLDDTSYLLSGVIEKPVGVPPSNMASLGRYVIKNDIFKYFPLITAVSGEMRLPDALDLMVKERKVAATVFSGRRYDFGAKSGPIMAAIDAGLRNPDTKEDLAAFLKTLDIKSMS